MVQFQCFIDAGGYYEPQWWTQTGWSWRQGRWDSQFEEDYRSRKYLQRRPKALRQAPMEWNVQRAYPNRPVVNICWFEAMAYCRWLEAQVKAAQILPLPDGYCLRLPTEAEWEKAARCGGSRRYPWGDEDWDETRANIGDSDIGHPTPVGMYPAGVTPTTELHDLGGNVWEWTLSRYRPYPYDPNDGRNDPEAEGRPVVRGGSWDSLLGFARAASRYRDPSVTWLDISGFRVVLSLANSEF